LAEDLLQAAKQTAERRNELLVGEVRRSQTKGELTDTSAVTHKNLPIQCLRGMAALFVALFHASAYAADHFGDSDWAAAFDGRFGLIGVAVFFAISGLLMAELIQRTDPWRFLAHRVVRIYPTYLLAVSASVPIVGFLGIRKFGPHVFSLMLVPVGHRSYYLNVEWTLVFECTYYVGLFLIALIGWRRHLNGIALVWIAVILAAPLFIGWSDNAFYSFYSIWLSPANAAFAGGLLVPWIVKRIRIPLGTGLLALGVLMVAVPANPMVARWAAGAAATLLVLDAVRIKMPQLAMLSLPKLGDWSYALYLCHVPCILIVYHFWPSSSGAGVAWFSAIATALIVSAGFGVLDVRMYRHLKNAVDTADEHHRRRRVNIYAGAFVMASLIGGVIV
jgi:exopolysaccharide production protein ExoZ